MRNAEFSLIDFSRYYEFTPAALAVRECARLSAVRKLDLAEPILDIGCGDGLFAQLAYPHRQSWGIDIDNREIHRAQSSGAYRTLVCGDIVTLDLPAGYFGSCIANCSLEHVPDIDGALRNIRGALKDGARFALVVPTPDWDQRLLVPTILRQLGLSGLSELYGDSLNLVFSHAHLLDEEAWGEKLRAAGFSPLESIRIAAAPVSWAFDTLLAPSLLGFFTKKATGRWILVPQARPLTVLPAFLFARAVGAIAERLGSGFSEYLIVCKA